MQVIVRRAAQSALIRNLDLTAPIVALVLAALLFFSGGCETSAPFKHGIASGGPRISEHADAYLAADTVTPADVKSVRSAQLVQFKFVTAAPITFRPVYDSWAGVRPWFWDYSSNDPALATDPTLRTLRVDMIAAFDKNVEQERKRRMIWFPFDTPPAITK